MYVSTCRFKEPQDKHKDSWFHARGETGLHRATGGGFRGHLPSPVSRPLWSVHLLVIPAQRQSQEHWLVSAPTLL